jgi:hypothetical protein
VLQPHNSRLACLNVAVSRRENPDFAIRNSLFDFTGNFGQTPWGVGSFDARTQPMTHPVYKIPGYFP